MGFDEMDALLLERTIAYIRALFQNKGDGHDLEHTLRVYRNALAIAESYPEADKALVSLGALLHDVDDYKLFQTENNENARSFLGSQGFDEAMIDRICDIINGVSFSHNQGRIPSTIEGKIVQDADRLDAIGAIGVARAFGFGGKKNRSTEQTLHHFDEKLLRLKGLMNTDVARKMAESRHAFMLAFLEEFEKERGPISDFPFPKD